jgi:hypothetical protein
MAAPGFGTSPFVLPNMFSPPGQALERGIDRRERREERQYDIDYRNQRNKEAEDWRKLNLIQELTNLDKYQTGEATADALGNEKAAEILQKYTAQAGAMSPAELQFKISQDINKTALGMGGIKDELTQSDKAIADLKQLYPTLNSRKLREEHRKEILSRRLKGDTDFQNPLDVQPSSFKLDDPDFVSYFVEGSKALTDAIRNPKYVRKGLSVAVGSPSSYTEMKGDLPFFRKLNYDPEKDVVKGFYKGKQQPSMDLKSSTINFKGKKTEILDEDAYSILKESDKVADLELRKEARQKFADYDLMTNAEKEIAKRSVALDKVKALDQSGFGFDMATKPPSNRTNIFIGGADFTGGGKTTGNELDRITENINLPEDKYSGEWNITGANIPKLTKAVLKTGGVEIGQNKPYALVYENGVIQEIRSIDGKELVANRDDMIIAQKKYDAERKGESQVFGVDDDEKKTKAKTYNVIDPKTGKVVLPGVSKEDAEKAKAKGYKIQ